MKFEIGEAVIFIGFKHNDGTLIDDPDNSSFYLYNTEATISKVRNHYREFPYKIKFPDGITLNFIREDEIEKINKIPDWRI